MNILIYSEPGGSSLCTVQKNSIKLYVTFKLQEQVFIESVRFSVTLFLRIDKNNLEAFQKSSIKLKIMTAI